MSNLIQNSDFQTPLLDSGIDLQYTAMTQQQAGNFVWVGMSNTYLNRDITYWGYPTPPTGVSSQYVNFQFDSLLYQNINVPTKGKYALTFFHCKRPGYSLLGLDILLDDVLITTIPSTISSTWTFFRIEFTIARTGNQILKFIQQNNVGNELAITNVSLVGLELLTDCGATYLPPLNFNQGKIFNIEDYEYQDKSLSMRSGDDRYLKSNTNINHNGDFYVDGDLTSRTFLNQPSNYFTNTTSNIQQQINDMTTKNLGGGYWSITAEGTVSTATNTGYNFAFGANLTTTNLYTFVCADSNLVGIGISHATSVTSAITIGIFVAASTTSKFNIPIPVTASAGRQFAYDLTSQNITFLKGNYFRLRTTAGAGAGATRLTFFFQSNGVKGDMGLTGWTGVTGSTGVTGWTGETGATGAIGPAGPAGPAGIAGPQGIQGIKGTDGAAGQNGTNGTNGINGVAGQNGTNGTNGINGVAGPAGERGPQGYTGEMGFTGYTGYTGFTGYTGCTGERGEKGDRGSDGANGANGADGADGDRGPKGDKGNPGDQGPMGAVTAVASVIACAASLAACGVAVTQCQGYAAAAIAANAGAGAAALQNIFNDYESLASGTTEYFYDALDNISQAADTVNGVAQNVNTLQSVVGTLGTSAVVGAAAGGLAGYLTLSNVKDKGTGDVYYLDNSYNIGFNTVGDVSFNANVYVGQNLNITGDINSQYLTNNYYTKPQVNTLVAPTTAISYNDVNVLTDYIKNGKFANPVVVGNEPYPYLWFTPNELSAFCWTTPYPNSLNILNGISETTLVRPLISVEVHFPSPALIGAVQYVWLAGKSEIQQVMNNIPVGVYQFSFRYSYLPSFPANPISIYFDGVLIETLPTYYNGNINVAGFTYNSSLDTSSKTTWYTYTKTITVSISGNKTLRFVGPNAITSKDIAIANVSFISSTQVKQTCISGGLINSVAIPIINPTFTDSTNKGTGLFWNSNSNQRSDIINYAGAGGAGGVDFWTINDFKPATNIASISNTGDISCNTLSATNVYTKSYIDTSLNENYYNKPYFDTSLNSNYYTKKGVDELRAQDYNTIKDELDNNVGNFYNKTYIDFSLNENYYNKPYINNTYYTKTAIDTNVYTKSAIDTSLNTNYYTKSAINTSLTNYYTKSAIDTSFSDVYSKISNPTYVGATFSEDVRVKKKLYIGKDDPAGYQISTDQAFLEYVGLGTDTNKTVLRINTTSDILNSGENDSINLNSTAGVGVNTDEPKYKFDVYNGTINSTLNAGINLRASNFSDSNYVGLASYLNQGNYNPITQLGDSGLIYNTDQTTHGLCIVPQSSISSGVRLDPNGSMVISEAIGNSTLSKSTGSLIIKHQNLNGVSSIVFPSSTQTDGGDFGYIKYIDDINNNAHVTTPYGGESSRLVIGVENDATGDTIADKIVLMTPSSNGCVGINKMTPICALDVNGDGSISGKLGINNTSPSCALDVTGDGKISGDLAVSGSISGSFSFYDIQTHGITNTNVINSGGISVTGSISTGSLTASGSITGGTYCKIGDESTGTSGGVLIAGRTKSFYPNPNDPYMIQTKRGLEIFWNTVPDTRNNYDGLAGDTTFMNYAGGLGQGGYSFQTTPGNGITPSANPTMLFEMMKGKDFTINGGLNISGNMFMSNKKVRTIRNFISFQAISGMVINHYNEDLFVYRIANGKYRIEFQNGVNPSNAYYSVSISGTWNGLADGNSGMVYSVENKTIYDFTITQKLSTGYTIEDGDSGNVSRTEVSVSY